MCKRKIIAINSSSLSRWQQNSLQTKMALLLFLPQRRMAHDLHKKALRLLGGVIWHMCTVNRSPKNLTITLLTMIQSFGVNMY